MSSLLRLACVVGLLASVFGQTAGRAADDVLLVMPRARATAPGEVLVISVSAPTSVVSMTSEWRERAVPFARLAPGAWQALIGLDVEEAPGPRQIRIVGRRPGAPALEVVHAFTIESRTWRTRRLTVARRFVTPPDSAGPRIVAETALLNELFRRTSAERLWAGDFVRPVEGVAVSGFGVRSVLNGQPRGPHNGADFAAPTGTPIVAPAAGLVAYARDFYFSGNTVILDHGHGLYSTMAHLSAFDVQEGARVERGQLLGKVGATGRVTGPHLHWAVRLRGARVDPESLLAVTD